jgi:hypothetical protein
MTKPTIEELAKYMLYWLDPETNDYFIRDEWFNEEREDVIRSLKKELSNYGLTIYDYEVSEKNKGYIVYLWVIDGDKYLKSLEPTAFSEEWENWFK